MSASNYTNSTRHLLPGKKKKKFSLRCISIRDEFATYQFNTPQTYLHLSGRSYEITNDFLYV